MADAKAAVDAVLRQEDARLAGVITNRASDRGGLTRYGLAAKWHPELVTMGFYSPAMSAAQALPIAERAYEVCYEQPLYLDEISSQAIATSLLSFAVNEGNERAVSMLQRAALVCGKSVGPGVSSRVGVDGRMGPATVAALNACDPKQLLNFYCDLEAHFYRGLAASDPTQNANLNGWLNRVQNDRELIG